MVLRGEGTRDLHEVALARQLCDRVQESGLPDAGLTSDQQELPVPGMDVRDPALGEFQQVIPPDEERTPNGDRRVGHGSKCRSPGNGVIGHSTDDGALDPSNLPLMASTGWDPSSDHGGAEWRNSWTCIPDFSE